MTCPIHKLDFKLIPAGVSKKTGRPYPAFEVCPVEGCNEKPQAPLSPSEPLDRVILEEKEASAIGRDEVRQRHIVRQNVLGHATELVKSQIYLSGKEQVESVKTIAEALEEWVYRE